MEATRAAVANEIKSNIGQDYSLAFELAEFEAEQEAEDVDAMSTEQRQALNAAMAEWWEV